MNARTQRLRARISAAWPWCAAALIVALSLPATAQDGGVPADEPANVSYIYAAVMGSGTYKINGRRITMLRIPFSLTQRRLEEGDEYGLKWYIPVVIGKDSVANADWLDELIDGDPVTLSVLPGFEYQWRLNDTWVIKPFGHLGAGHDFVLDEDILMGVLGVRALGTWSLGESAELRWGGALRFAGEYQLNAEKDYRFSLVETGLDYRRDTPYHWKDRNLNAGVYYRLSYFQPDWRLAETPFRRQDIEILHELGVSVGVSSPFEVFGFKLRRVRVGYKVGDGLEGWTIGAEFPF